MGSVQCYVQTLQRLGERRAKGREKVNSLIGMSTIPRIPHTKALGTPAYV